MPSSRFRLFRYKLERDGISSDRLRSGGSSSVSAPSRSMNRRVTGETGSSGRTERENSSRTRRARPVSSIAASSSVLHCSGMASKFWK